MTKVPVDPAGWAKGEATVLVGLGAGLVVGVAARGGRPAWALFGLFLLLAATALVAVATLPRPSRRVGLIGCLAALILLRIATAPVVGVPGAALAAIGLIGLALALALAERRPHAVPWIITLIVVVGALEAAWVLVQSVSEPAPLAAGLGEAPSGTFTNRNHLAAFLNLALGLAVGLLVAAPASRRRGRRGAEGWSRLWLAVLGIALVALAVLLSRSRGGILSLAAALGCAALLNLLWGLRTGRRSAAPVVALLTVTVAALALAAGPQRLAERFAEIGATDRPAVYRDTLRLVSDHPLTGVGPGMYRWRFRPYQTARLDLWYTHAHNDYLEVAAEWGIPLALVIWGFVGWRWLGLLRRSLSPEDSAERGWALGCATAMVALLAHGWIDFGLHIPAILLAFGILVGVSWPLAARGVAAPTAEPRRSRRRWELAARAMLAVLLLLAGWRIGRLLTAEMRSLAGRTVADLAAAVHAAPGAPRHHFRLGLAYRDLPQAADAGRARQHLERAVELNPWAWFHWLELAALEEMQGRPEAAERALREALRRNPRAATYRWRLANLLLRSGRTREALPDLQAALAVEPGLRDPAWSLMRKLELPLREVVAVWPAAPAARLDLVRRAVAAGRAADRPEILAQWERLVSGPLPPTIGEASFLIDHLLEIGALAEARARWVQLAASAGWEDDRYAAGSTLVWNGGFELPLTPSPLDWTPAAGGSVRRFAGEGGDGSTALRIEATGEPIPTGTPVSQLVAAEGGRRYGLAYRLRCIGLSGGAGARLELRDGDGGELLAAGPAVSGSQPWRAYSASLQLPEGAGPVRIALAGVPAGGTVWLDEVVLEPSP